MVINIRDHYDHFIGGQFVASQCGYIDSISPVNHTVVTRISKGNRGVVEKAVQSSLEATNEWRNRKPIERGRILIKLAQMIRENKTELARIECAETGKPDLQASLEIEGAATYFEFYGGLVNLPHGKVIDMGPQYHTFTLMEPYGVVAVITPWNVPMNQGARCIAPALAVGNTVVIKPSEYTSATTVELASMAKECGLPDGVLNVVLGDGPEVGAELVAHPDVRKVAFTGSARAGRIVGHVAAERIIPVTLELGGKSPNIIFEDADLEKAIPASVNAFTFNCGQACSAGSRLLVQESIVEEVVARLKVAVSEIVPGKNLGPLTTPEQYQKVISYFEIAEEEGLEVIAGGRDIPIPSDGNFVAPTIFRIHDLSSKLYHEEIFGPVLVLTTFENEEEAIEMANDSEYGLVSGVWTQNLSRAHRVAPKLQSGQVFVNDWVIAGVEAPFGGYKASGIGREKGVEAMHHYAQLKSVMVKL